MLTRPARHPLRGTAPACDAGAGGYRGGIRGQLRSSVPVTTRHDPGCMLARPARHRLRGRAPDRDAGAGVISWRHPGTAAQQCTRHRPA
ncbi:hypothetical protein ACFH4J_003384 [Escherichia coli]